MFKRLSDRPVAEVQNQQVEKWKEEDLLKKCVDAREGKTPFIFYEGPPTANGKPGIHHVGLSGQQKSRMGYPRSSCRDRSGKAA